VIGASAVFLAVAIGAAAGSWAGARAGVLAALAGLMPPAILAAAVERRQRLIARDRERRDILRKFAPPAPAVEDESER
jgi:hypothetical protein